MNRAALCVLAFLVIGPVSALAQSGGGVNMPPDVMADPSNAGVAAVNSAADLLRAQSPEAAVAYLSDALNQARNAAVQRAIRFQLVQFYKEAGRPDKALEVLKDLIASIPPQPAPQLVQLVPAETPADTTAPKE